MTGLDFFELLHVTVERFQVRSRRAGQQHLDKGYEITIQLRRIGESNITANETLALETPDAFEAWRGTQVYLASQIDIGDTAILLDDAQDTAINSVELSIVLAAVASSHIRIIHF